jgi:hypothetical protein
MPTTFYQFPNNVTGGAAIPILGTPTPLAEVTVSVGVNSSVSVRATVGWMAQFIGLNSTRVIFKIWRGAPVTGVLVVSVEDSGESNFDKDKVTTFTGVDFGFTSTQTVTYVVTAELPNAGTAAQVIGGLTFTTNQFDLTIPDRRSFFTTLPNNMVGGASIPVTTVTVPLAALLVHVNANDNVTLRSTIGWVAQAEPTSVLFQLWRGAPITGNLVVSVLDSGESSFDNNRVTSFDGVDTGFTSAQDVDYVLTAETTVPGTSALVIGAVTVTGVRYPLLLQQSGESTAEANDPENVLSFYTLPDNTAGSVSIPISLTPQPLALVNVAVGVNTQVVLRGTVGWSNTSQFATPKADVVYKLWRGAPVTGSLIFSVDDSVDVERNKVTSFAQVDTGFTAAQEVTYVLTAELPNIGKSAVVVGALTLTAVEESLT